MSTITAVWFFSSISFVLETSKVKDNGEVLKK